MTAVCSTRNMDRVRALGADHVIDLLFGPLLSMGRQKFGTVLMKPSHADLLVLKELCEAGKVRPVIDRRFPLSDVSSAVRYVEDGHARGKVAVTV